MFRIKIIKMLIRNLKAKEDINHRTHWWTYYHFDKNYVNGWPESPNSNLFLDTDVCCISFEDYLNIDRYHIFQLIYKGILNV